MSAKKSPKPKRKVSAAQKRAQETFKKVRKVCAVTHEPFSKGFGKCMKAEYAELKKK